jgi:hypothetical protein
MIGLILPNGYCYYVHKQKSSTMKCPIIITSHGKVGQPKRLAFSWAYEKIGLAIINPRGVSKLTILK